MINNMERATELKLPVPWGYVAAKAWGSPSNFPVLCVHGILDNASAFDNLVALLPNNFYYVSIDLPGHGFSTHFAPGLPLDFFNYLLTLRYILAELKWESFYYIGHSLGAQLGAFYSIFYPGKIKKMILIEGLVPRSVPNEHIIKRTKEVHNTAIEDNNNKNHRWYSYDEIMHTLLCRRSVSLNTKAAKAIFNRAVTKDGEMYKYNRDHRLKIYIFPILSMEHINILLSNLNVPILFCLSHGTLDFYDLSMFTDIFKNLNNSKVVYVEGNHDVHNNHPERLSHHIKTFFNDKNKVVSKL